MAISTDATIHFFGTQDDLNSSSAAVSDGAFSVAGDLAAWTNDDDAPYAMAMLTWQYASGTLAAGAYAELHARRLNIQTTNDEEVPSDDYYGAYVGSFWLDDGLATATNSVSVLKIPLPNFKTSQEYEFYIRNSSGVTLSAGWDVEIVPITTGPSA